MMLADSRQYRDSEIAPTSFIYIFLQNIYTPRRRVCKVLVINRKNVL